MKLDSTTTKEFVKWLEQEVQVKTWLPSIDTETTLTIKRIEFIKICGNISKHNFSRLSGVANELMRIFKRNDIAISFEDALLVPKQASSLRLPRSGADDFTGT